MPDFVPVKALKKEPLRASCAIDCAQHCPMDILLEELHEMGDVDVLVVGVGECAYYSRKMPFSGGRRNWAYQLEDREIILASCPVWTRRSLAWRKTTALRCAFPPAFLPSCTWRCRN